MALRIKTVRLGSPAHRAQVKPGQLLVEMSGHPVQDVLDYQFYLHDENVRLTLKDGATETREVSFRKDYHADLGIGLPDIEPRRCQNKCIFCFVDQLPARMRKTLYFKDEDYRLSFLQGSYITATDLKEHDIERIVQQRLSPLYVSVHSTDELVRQHLLGRREIPPIIRTISRLAQGNIQLHCQLVICPGINDGRVLERSVQDLSQYFPAVESVAIVPVGLTGHRRGLLQVKSITPDLARHFISQVDAWQRSFRGLIGRGFVYLADEIFLMAGEKVPPANYYDGFPQRENGVGMVRQFLDLFAERQKGYPAHLSKPESITLITGWASAMFMEEVVAKRLSQIENLLVHLQVVPNNFFGGGVTVSGLLTGADILQTLRQQPPQGTVILPPDCLNAAGLFLDDVSIADLEAELGARMRSSTSDKPLACIEEIWS